LGVIKVFPVKFRFPPLQRFGNDHNPKAILKELEKDEPDIVHFHEYYLFSFSYLAPLIKNKIRTKLTTQLHRYHQNFWRRIPYLPCLQRLRLADRVFYSYTPEEDVYRALGLSHKTVKIPIPSIDPALFRPNPHKTGGPLLYVGRLPNTSRSYAEKNPLKLLYILKRMLSTTDADLTIIGDGVGLDYYKKTASKLGVSEQVRFTGFIKHEKVPEFYRESSLTCVPLKIHDVDGYFDGGIQESLACGTPVAAFKTSVNTPLKGKYGYLLSNDTEKAAAEICEILDDSQQLEKTARNGSEFIHSHCTEGILKETLREEWEALAG
jgi:glycosyltransferase involved in cell wall biosynthesis